MRALCIYFISLFILSYSYNLQEKRGFTKRKENPLHQLHFIVDREQSLYDHFRDQELIPLLMGFLLGKTQGMAPDMKEDYGRLYLQHLFVPAGLHLTAILLLLWPVKKWGAKGVFKKILILCCFLIFFLPEFYAFKRMALFRLILLLFHWLKLRDTFYVFLLVFLLDFLFGTFQSSPLSFAYSFVFFGLIISFPRHYPKSLLMVYLLCGEILVCYFQHTQLLGLGFIVNNFISLLFSVIYPLVFFLFLVHLDFLLEWTLYLFNLLVSDLSWFCLKTGHFISSLPLIFACVIFISEKLNKQKIILFFIFLFLHCEELL